MMSDENHITLILEGTDREEGHVKFSQFLAKLTGLAIALNGIDRLVGGTSQPTLEYRVVDLGHSSPAFITLEPIVKKTVRKPPPDYIEIRHHRFFVELENIRAGETSPELEEGTLRGLQTIVQGLGREFKSATIRNSEARIELDPDFQRSVTKATQEDASYGGLEGMLEAVNIHGGARRFWLYPKIGAKRVRCEFLPGTKEEVREALGHYVRVEGYKYFRSNSPFPHRVTVRDFEVLDDRDGDLHISELGGAFGRFPKEISTLEFIRSIRDAWD